MPPCPQQPARATPTTSRSGSPHSHAPRVAREPRPRQPSHDGFSARAICKPSFHHHPPHTRPGISQPHLPAPLAPSPPPPLALDRTQLSVPSRLRPFRRPPSSMPQVRYPSEPRVPLERAAARVCREAGARVTTAAAYRCSRALNWLLTQHWCRHSRQAPRRHNGTYTGAALHQARRAKERTYPELTRGGRCKLVVLGFEPSFDYWQEHEHDLLPCMPAWPRSLDLCTVGLPFFPM